MMSAMVRYASECRDAKARQSCGRIIEPSLFFSRRSSETKCAQRITKTCVARRRATRTTKHMIARRRGTRTTKHMVGPRRDTRTTKHMVAPRRGDGTKKKKRFRYLLTISHIAPAGYSPARRARSTAASVCPCRVRTPPARHWRGNICPGLLQKCISISLLSYTSRKRERKGDGKGESYVWQQQKKQRQTGNSLPVSSCDRRVRATWPRDRGR